MFVCHSRKTIGVILIQKNLKVALFGDDKFYKQDVKCYKCNQTYLHTLLLYCLKSGIIKS